MLPIYIWRRDGCEGMLGCWRFGMGEEGCCVWAGAVGRGVVGGHVFVLCASWGSGELMGMFRGSGSVGWVVLGGAVGMWSEDVVMS